MKKNTTAPLETPQPQEDERSESSVGGGGSSGARGPTRPGGAPDPEVVPRATRRRFGAAYKVRILEAVDACTKPGEVGALLRREGLYSSHLTKWRRAREQGQLAALAPRRRGPKPDPDRPLVRRNAQLEREVVRLGKCLEVAETIIEVQGNVSRLLGLTMPQINEKNA